MKKFTYILLLLFIGISVSSCNINSYVMLKTKERHQDMVITDSIPLAAEESYRLTYDDKFTMRFFVEDGKRVIDAPSGVSGIGDDGGSLRGVTGSGSTSISYKIRKNGEVELPILGLIKLGGLTIIEAQELLKELYSEFYIDPFIQIEVTNRRVIVFTGGGGNAKIVPIVDDNTTLMEILASAGGITGRGKSKNIKIFREVEGGREVYQVDLSTLDGLAYADMIVQSNDYIYVEPAKRLSQELLQEITPIVSLVSVTMTIIAMIMRFK